MSGKMNLNQSLKQEQRLAPAQLQLINLLPLTSIELREQLEKLTEENPALELEAPEEEGIPQEEKSKDDEKENAEEDFSEELVEEKDEPKIETEEDPYEDFTERQEYFEAMQEGVYYAPEEEKDIPIKYVPSVYEYMKGQLSGLKLSEKERKIADFIIGSLDDHGLLPMEPRKLASHLRFKEKLNVTEEEVKKVIRKIQTLDPPGIAAKDTREALLLQLERLPDSPLKEKAQKLLKKYTEKLAKKDYKYIMRSMNISREELREVLNFIRKKLTAKPFVTENNTTNTTEYVSPDFQIDLDFENKTYKVKLLNYRMPRLRISRKYENDYLKLRAKKKQDKLSKQEENYLEFLTKKIQAAKDIVEAIERRKNVLEGIVKAIIEMQKDYFFSSGDRTRLKPMILEDIEKAVKLDKSSISRALKSKYAKTPFGMIKLRSLLSEAVDKKLPKEKQLSNEAIKAIIKNLIDNEDKQSPYKDDELLDLLIQDYGIKLARRTVAKYREALGFPRAGLRKEL